MALVRYKGASDLQNLIRLPLELRIKTWRYGLMKILPVEGSSTWAPRGMPRTSIRL